MRGGPSGRIGRIVASILTGFFIVLLSLPAAAAEADCRTSCPAGPKEYKKSVTWNCVFYTGRGLTINNMTREREIESSECILRVQGRFSDVKSSPLGRYKDFNDCFENFCVQKMVDICGVEDRCAEPDHWIKSGTQRFR